MSLQNICYLKSLHEWSTPESYSLSNLLPFKRQTRLKKVQRVKRPSLFCPSDTEVKIGLMALTPDTSPTPNAGGKRQGRVVCSAAVFTTLHFFITHEWSR